MDKLCFDPIGIKQHGLVYTALSCIRDISFLYILCKLKTTHFVVGKKVRLENKILEKTSSWKIDLNVCSFQTSGHIVLCSINTRLFSIHSKNILADHDFMYAYFLCIQETRLIDLPLFSQNSIILLNIFVQMVHMVFSHLQIKNM